MIMVKFVIKGLMRIVFSLNNLLKLRCYTLDSLF